MDAYENTVKYILDIPKFAGKNTLSDTRNLLSYLYKEKSSRIIHIAGTNGKGSTAAYMDSILRRAGVSVGLFTSPHLVSMNERIRVNGKEISDEAFVKRFNEVMEAVKKEGDEHHPSFFEFLFLMAMRQFYLEKTEYIILETGLGGRLDATNCVLNKDLCIITNIAYDHTEYLGDTLPKIAYEKAGIISKGVPVVYLNGNPEADEVIRKRAEELNCKRYELSPADISLLTLNKESIDFSYHSEYYRFDMLTIGTYASYQTINASLAALSALVLADKRITRDVIYEGIKDAKWQGRFERIGDNIYADGAHNPDGIRAFLSSVSALLCKGNRLLIFGVVSDKDYGEMIRLICESKLFDEVSVTPVNSARRTSIDVLEDLFKAYPNQRVKFFDSLKSAYNEALKLKKAEDMLYIAGSLYLVGELKELTGI